MGLEPATCGLQNLGLAVSMVQGRMLLYGQMAVSCDFLSISVI